MKKLLSVTKHQYGTSVISYMAANQEHLQTDTDRFYLPTTTTASLTDKPMFAFYLLLQLKTKEPHQHETDQRPQGF